MKRIGLRRIFKLALSLLMIFLLLFPLAESWQGVAIAAPISSEITHGMVMYQSQMTLWDLSHRPWNLLVFKQMYPDAVENLQLRVTGQSGEGAIAPRQVLILTNGAGLRLEAANTTAEVFSVLSEAEPMQQFNLQPVFNQLSTSEGWQLQFRTADGALAKLPVSREVIQQWQIVAACQGLVCDQDASQVPQLNDL